MVVGTLVLKDLIIAIHLLTQQLNLSIEKRNSEIIDKTYIRLKESLKEKELFKESDGVEKIMINLNAFFKMLSIVDK
jgi:hypothetical protein